MLSFKLDHLYLSMLRVGWSPWTSMYQEEAAMTGWRPLLSRSTKPVSEINQCLEQSLESEREITFFTSPFSITGSHNTFGLGSQRCQRTKKQIQNKYQKETKEILGGRYLKFEFIFFILPKKCRLQGAPFEHLRRLIRLLWGPRQHNREHHSPESKVQLNIFCGK